MVRVAGFEPTASWLSLIHICIVMRDERPRVRAARDGAEHGRLDLHEACLLYTSVAGHHFLGLCNGLAGREVRMLRQDELRHGVAVGGDDAGDDEEQ